MLLAGCAANPPGNDSSQVIHTLRGRPVAFTHIVLGSALSQAHFSATSLWAIRHGPWFFQSQVRIDPETFEMVEFPRPFSGMGINFLADENSLWTANLQTSALGGGVAIDCALPTGMVRRIDPRNGAVIAEIDV